MSVMVRALFTSAILCVASMLFSAGFNEESVGRFIFGVIAIACFIASVICGIAAIWMA